MAKILFCTPYDTVNHIGLSSMSNYLKQNGHEVSILTFKQLTIDHGKYFTAESAANYETINDGLLSGSGFDINPYTQHEIDLMHQVIEKESPDIIGYSTRSFLDEKNVTLLKGIRQRFPNIPIAAGGYGPSFSPELYADIADMVMIGEGEHSIVDMAQAIDEGRSLYDVKNLAYRKNGKLVFNEMYPPIKDVDSFHYVPVRGVNSFLVEDDKVEDVSNGLFRESIYTMIARGCPGHCTYCCASSWKSLYDGEYSRLRRKSVRAVIDELTLGVEYGGGYVNFEDSFLVAPMSYMEDLFTQYKEKIDIPFYAQFHPRQVNQHPEILDMAVEAGLDCVSVGIQSGSESFRKSVYKRDSSNQEIIEFSKNLAERNIRQLFHFITGNPLNTTEDHHESLKLIRELQYTPLSDSITIFRLCLFPGTPLKTTLDKDGIFDKYSNFDWLYWGMLYSLRFVMGDDEFESVLASPYFKKQPYMLGEVFKDAMGEYLAREKETIIEHQVFMYQGYKKRLDDVKNRSNTVLWGTGSGLALARDYFKGVNVLAVVDNATEKHGTKVFGMDVVAPEYLKQIKGANLYICTDHSLKKMIVEQVVQMGCDVTIH